MNISQELKSSAINPGFMGNAVRLVGNDENQVYELLERKIALNGRQVPHDFGDSMAFFCEDGEVFQVKPGNPSKDAKGKVIKYLGVSDRPNTLFMPAVPDEIRDQIGITRQGSFWEAVKADSDIKIVITEGAKKALCLLSHGIVSVGLSGIENSTVIGDDGDRVILPELEQLIVPGREIVICFDEDEKPKTRRAVSLARQKLGARILAVNSLAIVKITSWDSSLGKGIDDVAALSGDEVVKSVIDKATAVTVTGDGFAPSSKNVCYKLTDKGPARLGGSEIAIKLRSAHPLVLYNRKIEAMCAYDGKWNELTPIEARAIVTRFMEKGLVGSGVSFESSHVKSVLDLWENSTSRDFPVAPSNLIPFMNGVVDRDDLTLAPHDPEHGLFWNLPFNWEPGGCQENNPIVEWLRSCHDSEETVQLLRAYAYLCVSRGNATNHKILCLIGAAGSGKSTFSKLVSAIVGIENTAVSSFAMLGDRFGAGQLSNKSLIILPDVASHTGNLEELKQVSGGDPIRHERKNKNTVTTFVHEGGMIISANSPIDTKADPGLERRMLPVYWNKAVDPSRFRDLIRVSESGIGGEFAAHLPGFIQWVLELGAQKAHEILHRKTSIGSADIVRSLVDSSSLAKFLYTRCKSASDGRVRVGVCRKRTEGGRVTIERSDLDLYPAYVQACMESNQSPVSLNRFSTQVTGLCKSLFPQDCIEVHRTREGVFVFGLVLLPPGVENYTEPTEPAIVVTEPAIEVDEEDEEFTIDFEYSEPTAIEVDSDDQAEFTIDFEYNEPNEPVPSARSTRSKAPVKRRS